MTAQSNRERIVVAMSGGVDSSVAAALLHEQGHEVIGISLKLWQHRDQGESQHGCCTPDDLRDARRVAEQVGFPHYVFDMTSEFDDHVVQPFVQSYLGGRTPNPCITCNDTVKFDTLLARSRALGARYLATGHYARIEHLEAGAVRLRQGVDPTKDQSYFLYNLPSSILEQLLFPIGALTKSEVREKAHAMGLVVAGKPDSQEICFVPNRDYAGFIEDWTTARDITIPEGKIVANDVDVMGHHDGVHRFTIGQRKGLGVTAGEPLYVHRIDAASGDVHVGPQSALECAGLRLGACNWIGGHLPPPEQSLTVRVRHQHRGAPCTLRAVGDTVEAHFLEPVFGIAAGQAAVFFDGDVCLGGGTIEGSLRS